MYENRLKKILMILVKMDEESYSAGYLSSILRVSKNTVRNDINHLRHSLKSYGAEISSKSGSGNGYQLMIMNQTKFDDFLTYLDQDNSYRKYSPESRVLVLSMLLIKENSFIKTEALADILYLSNKQVSKDLVAVKCYLEKYKLSITSRPHYGICIEGTEYRKRLCLNRVFECNRELFLEFNQIDISKLENLLIKLFMHWEVSITSTAVQSLTIYIAVLLDRICRGYNIGIKSSVLQVQYKMPEYKVAKELQRLLENDFSVKISDGETGYMALLIAGKHIIDHSNLNCGPSLYVYLITKIKERINSYYHWNIQEHEDLLLELKKYLYPMIVRIDFDLFQGEVSICTKYHNKFLLSYAMGIRVAEVINEILNCNLTDFDILNIAAIFQEHINKINKKKKRVLAVTAADGEGLLILTKSVLLQDFGVFIEKLDFKPTYKISLNCIKDYDVLLDLDRESEGIITLYTDNGFSDIRKKLSNTYLYESSLDTICDYNQIGSCEARTIEELMRELSNRFSNEIKKAKVLEIFPDPDIIAVTCSNGVLFMTICKSQIKTSLYLMFSINSILYNHLYIKGIILIIQNPDTLYTDYPIYEELGNLIGSDIKIEKLSRACTYDNLKNIMGVQGNV